MATDEDNVFEKARECFQSGLFLEAGRLIFERLPNEIRPSWAVKILRLVLDRTGVDRTHFERLLYTADHPRLWGNGHRAFDILRDEGLRLLELHKKRKLTKQGELMLNLISLAELVAKVTYNAADPPDPFDEDSGWWIAPSLKGFTDMWKDEDFSKAAWSALCWSEE
jgi:hypothetical protein